MCAGSGLFLERVPLISFSKALCPQKARFPSSAADPWMLPQCSWVPPCSHLRDGAEPAAVLGWFLSLASVFPAEKQGLGAQTLAGGGFKERRCGQGLCGSWCPKVLGGTAGGGDDASAGKILGCLGVVAGGGPVRWPVQELGLSRGPDNLGGALGHSSY